MYKGHWQKNCYYGVMLFLSIICLDINGDIRLNVVNFTVFILFIKAIIRNID